MNRRLSKLLKEYEKYQEKVVDLACDNAYLTKDNLKDLNQNIYLNIKNKQYQDIEDLLKYTINSLFKCKYIKIYNENDFLTQNIFYLNYSNNDDYIVSPDRGLIDYEKLQKLIISKNPKYIFVGSTYYTRFIDYKKIKEIANLINAKIIVDISNISGLILTNHVPSPFEYADYIICTLNKQLQGTNETILLSNTNELTYDLSINSTINTLNTLLNVTTDEYKELINNCLINTKEIKFNYVDEEENISLLSLGTDNNLLIINTEINYQIKCKDAFNLLLKNDIIIKENNLGIILNTSNMTFKGYTPNDFYLLGKKINKILKER